MNGLRQLALIARAGRPHLAMGHAGRLRTRHRRSRVWLAASVCSTALLLSGCLEIAQHVTMVDRRTASVFVKVGIATAIVEMAGRFSDGEVTAESACEELTGSRDEIVPDYLPRNARLIRFDAVDTRFECGMIFQFEYDVRVRREEATDPIPFLVWVTPREARIDLPIAGSGEPLDETALTLLASSKYRLTISKTVLKSVSAAQVTYSYQGTERTADLDVIDMVDQHLVELPMSTLFAAEDVVTVTLRR